MSRDQVPPCETARPEIKAVIRKQPHGDMEPLLQSVQQYVDLLKRCRTPEVANWKPKDLEHSLHWASYFKNVNHQGDHHAQQAISSYGQLITGNSFCLQVYEKVKGKESVRRKLESHLTSLKQHIAPGFGTNQLSFDFLPHGIDYLLKVSTSNYCMQLYL